MTEVTAHHGIFKDIKLHVDDTGGTGRPVVLIHGWPLSGESFKLQAAVAATSRAPGTPTTPWPRTWTRS